MNREHIAQTLKYLFEPKDVFEICMIGSKIRKSALWGNEYAGGKKPIIAGWFNDFEKAADIIVAADKMEPVAIYVTLNPVNKALLARANNRLKASVNRTKDTEIIEVRNILVDADPTRPAGISSTEMEKDSALQLLWTIYSELKVVNWPEPLVADSGNGGHLIYPVEPGLANLIPGLLKALDRKYSTDTVNIDTTVGNPARLVKVYGTVTRKGDSTEDRPYRTSKILSLPKEVS